MGVQGTPRLFLCTPSPRPSCVTGVSSSWGVTHHLPHLGKNPCSHSLTHPGLKHLHFEWLHIRYPWDPIYMWTVMLSIYTQIPFLLLVVLRCQSSDGTPEPQSQFLCRASDTACQEQRGCPLIVGGGGGRGRHDISCLRKEGLNKMNCTGCERKKYTHIFGLVGD